MHFILTLDDVLTVALVAVIAVIFGLAGIVGLIEKWRNPKP